MYVCFCAADEFLEGGFFYSILVYTVSVRSCFMSVAVSYFARE